MLKLISLFFISIFIISCGGEVGTVYYNDTNPSSGITDNTHNSVNPPATNPIVKLKCLPGTTCNTNKPPVKVAKLEYCLPGRECNPINIQDDTSKDKDKKTNSETNSSSKKINESCLPGTQC